MKAQDLKDEKTLEYSNPIDIILKETHGFVDMEHGSNTDGDYIWHFMPGHNLRKFPDNLDKIYQILVTYLNKVIPEEIRVDVYPPQTDWEIKLITVVARKIKKHWTYDFDNMKKYLPIIGSKISEIMERAR